MSCPCQYLNPDHPFHSLDSILTELSLVLTVILIAKYSNDDDDDYNIVVVVKVFPADILHFFTFKFMKKSVLTFCLVNAGDGHFAISSLGYDNDENFLFSPDIRFSTDSCL
jgi:hypothetical protein